MGLISFIREKGEKLFGKDGSEAKAATGATAASGATGTGGGSTAGAAGTAGAGGGLSQPPGTNATAPAGGPASGPATAAAGHSQVQDAAAARAIESYIAAMNLTAKDLRVIFDPGSATVTVSGEAPDQATREKIVLCCGNVTGVEKVDDRMTVARTEAEATLYTVVEGDSLSKIAKQHYGNANAYMTIFEANQPMLKHPDKIYPGQVLRIPPQGQ